MEGYKEIKNKIIRIITALLLIALNSSYAKAENNVGTLNGSLSVNDMGAAIYSVPLDIFKSGTNFDPQIGLAYNSQQDGYGNAGYGISVTGISSITRAGKDLFHDNEVQKVKYEKGDTYMLDGQRLILKSGTYGESNATYSVEGNPYITITQKYSDSGLNNESMYFTYTDATGTTYEYKARLNCVINGLTKTTAWYISKATNKYGDCIDYK